MFVRVWDRLLCLGGRLGCRVLDRHHYRACRGRSDHGPASDRYGYPVRRR